MKKLILCVVGIVAVLTLLFAGPVLAGENNQNGDAGKSSERGTEKINNIDGCRPNIGGDYWVYIDNPLLDDLVATLGFPPPPPDNPSYYHEWKGGPCCPSNELALDTINQYPKPNQCCNGPDEIVLPDGTQLDGEPAPGNHCLCFENQGYPFPALIVNYPSPA